MNFLAFTRSTVRNAWIREKGINIYVRDSIHPGIDYDLANLDADKPGAGAFTRFLDKFDKLYTFKVELIHNERLIGYLERRGYKRLKKRGDLGIHMSNKEMRRDLLRSAVVSTE